MKRLLTMFLTCCVALSFLGLFGLCNKKDDKKTDTSSSTSSSSSTAPTPTPTKN